MLKIRLDVAWSQQNLLCEMTPQHEYLFQDILKVQVSFLRGELQLHNQAVDFVDHQDWADVFQPRLPQDCLSLRRKEFKKKNITESLIAPKRHNIKKKIKSNSKI